MLFLCVESIDTVCAQQATVSFLSQLLNEELMRERETEIRNINRGMHQVNEIYKVRFDASQEYNCLFVYPVLKAMLGMKKDLAHIVGNQQEQIDQIEGQMENSRANAEQGLSHIQKANEKASTSSQCTIS